MLTQQTLQTLRRLKLNGMAEAFEQQLTQPTHHELSFEERFGLLVDRELSSRDNRRLTRLLKAAKLKYNASAEDINYRHPRGLQRAQMASLLTGDWVRQRQHVLLVGPTGCGKTWLSCALANQALPPRTECTLCPYYPFARRSTYRPRRRQLSQETRPTRQARFAPPERLGITETHPRPGPRSA